MLHRQNRKEDEDAGQSKNGHGTGGTDRATHDQMCIRDSPIIASRKDCHNGNGLILGTPGSGKSFAAKREMTHVVCATRDDVLLSLIHI